MPRAKKPQDASNPRPSKSKASVPNEEPALPATTRREASPPKAKTASASLKPSAAKTPKKSRQSATPAQQESVQPSWVFNFAAVKQWAKPGSWRRGYGYYKTPGQVMRLEPTPTGVHGEVKGNYQAAYQIQLTFAPESVVAQCDCPLEEEWCKHAVAVALTAIESKSYEQFYNLPAESVEIAPALDQTLHLEGTYRFGLNWGVKPKCISLQLWNRRTQEAVPRLEPILKAALALQKSGELTLNPAERKELKLIQHLYKHCQPDPTTGWVHVPYEEQQTVWDMLAEQEELVYSQDMGLIRFETEPWHLVLSINASLVGNVLVSLHWHYRGQPADIVPLEEITVFNKHVPLGYLRHRIYPLVGSLKNLPNMLTRGTFYDIRDADGGKFLFEELPKIQQFVEVERAQIIDKATLEQNPPKRFLTLRAVGQNGLRAELEFGYDETRMPYSKGNEAPYVTVTDKAADSIYWLKRDKKAEEKAYKTLTNRHLQPMQSNHFEALLDDAIEFYSLEKPQLEADGWMISEEDDLSHLLISPHPLQLRAKLDFAPDSVDTFSLALDSVVGDEVMPLETVQGFLVQGRKYVELDGKGYVEIPLVPMLSLNKTLVSFDKETVGEDTFLIKTFQAGLLSELQEQGVQLAMSQRFQPFWDLVMSFNQLEEVAVPAEVKAELRTYQKQGFNWLWFLYSYGLNGILADDMGLGKTLQTLVLLQKAKNEDGRMPALVICPTSVVYNWQNECKRFTPDLTVLNLTGSERHHHIQKIQDADVVITSYALLRRDVKILRQLQFRYVILDESQNIKNVESQTAQAAKQLNCQHRLALSGTPLENRLSELWSAFDFLMPGFLLDLDEFRYRYINPIEEKGNRDAERRLKKQIAPFILRRLKRDVAKDLPPKVENVMVCEMLPEQQTLYMDVLEQTRNELFAQFNQQGQAVNQASMLSSLLRLRQVCNHPKLLKDFMAHEGVGSGKFDALKEMLQEITSEGHRVLLFSQFVEMLKLIQPWLETQGIRYEMLTGETKNEDRQVMVDRFNRNESIPVFLISLKAGGTGLNLTGADYVIHYDPWWNPAVEEQATDRAYRIGQKKTVFVYRFITRGTVEEKIMKLKARKRDLVDTVISVDRDLAKKMTFEDLKDILTPEF